MDWERGPLPQWTRVGGYGSSLFEATDPGGCVWRLRWVEDTEGGPSHYLLSRRDEPDASVVIPGQYGLYYALDWAGMRIAEGAVRVDAEGARRQLGFE